jgi:acyl-CoA thioester hydrolase
LAKDSGAHPRLEDFPFRYRDIIRFSDTDMFGHVSNSAFGIFLATGRGQLTHGGENDLADAGCVYVLVRTEIDYLGQMSWPGEAESGLRISHIGQSSLILEQAVYQDGEIKGRSVSVLVQMEQKTGVARPLSDRARGRLEEMRAAHRQ